jgi:hypothetical protein
VATKTQTLINQTVTGIGLTVAAICSFQIACIPTVLIIVYVPVLFPKWAVFLFWLLFWIPTCYYSMRISRMRFGMLAILALTALAFAISDASVADLNHKYERKGK